MPETAAVVTARTVLAAARAAGRAALSEAEAKRVLAGFGIAVPRAVLTSAAPAPGATAGLTPPFVVKVVSPDILHKTEAGGVALGLADEPAVAAAIAAMAAHVARAGWRVSGWLIEEMAPAGVEMVVGGLHDARFGPVVMCGLGGILVELLEDVAFGICPLEAIDCDDMLATLRGAAMLRGWRGAPAAAVASLRDVLLRVGGPGGILAMIGPEIAELDINPLIVSPVGAVAADARIVLRRGP